jgi:hypothetical protein
MQSAGNGSIAQAMITLTTYVYCCRPNGHRFDAPEAPNYGQFVLRSMNDRLPASVFVIGNAAFQEVGDLLREEGLFAGLDELQQAQVLQHAFGAACDPAPDGSLYMMNMWPKCPVCGSVRMRSWNVASPPRPVADPVPEVSHSQWQRLDRGAKVDRLRYALGLRIDLT